MKQIVLRLICLLKENTSAILVTILKSDGSVPRKAGAQMLVGEAGLLAGSIGGGSVERESLAFSQALLVQKRSAVRSFSLTVGGELGMVCGGSVTAHFQYIPGGDTAWLSLSESLLARLLENKPGFLILTPDGSLPRLAEEAADADLAQGFALALPVRERALLFGAGHVAQALCPLLARVGFSPVVYDPREDFVTAERFPDAETRICAGFENISARLIVNAADYAVVMTSGHRYDTLIQEQLLRGEFAYLGVIGSRRKKAAVFDALRAAGISEEKLAQIHMPIGLPIGAETPEEIAVSIAAEMVGFRASRRP